MSNVKVELVFKSCVEDDCQQNERVAAGDVRAQKQLFKSDVEFCSGSRTRTNGHAANVNLGRNRFDGSAPLHSYVASMS